MSLCPLCLRLLSGFQLVDVSRELLILVYKEMKKLCYILSSLKCSLLYLFSLLFWKISCPACSCIQFFFLFFHKRGCVKVLDSCCVFVSWQAKRDLNDPENAMLGAFAGNFISIRSVVWSIQGFFCLNVSLSIFWNLWETCTADFLWIVCSFSLGFW